VLFTDEKIFTLDETGKHPQVKFYAKKGQQHKNIPISSRPPASHSPGVMVWGGISQRGRTPLIFVEPGVKINALYYQNSILTKMKEWCMNSVGGTSKITLQQDWALAHRAKSSKTWLRSNNIAFWDENVYPAASPDLNPMDFSVWGWMLQHLRDTSIPSVDLLKVRLLEIWENLNQNSIDQAIDQVPVRLESLMSAEGGRFEK
jgi:inhibitor of nuclear factor kappa-B kinase subunit alpha